MRLRHWTMGLAGVLAIGTLALVPASADAGCGGGGGYRGGGYGGGHTFGRASYGGSNGGSCCGMGMASRGTNNMAGMNMAGAGGYADSTRPAGSASAATATGRNGPATTGVYTCPMHPNVVSSTPGSCPYCGMALTRR
jgi:hypothetical protein